MFAHRVKNSPKARMLLSIFSCTKLTISTVILISGSLAFYLDHFRHISRLQQKLETEYDFSHYWLSASVSCVINIFVKCIFNSVIYVK